MTIKERNKIIMSYLPTLKKIASKNYIKTNYIKNKELINYIEQKELINMGIFGLIKAIDKYEKSNKKISFGQFSYKYVDGSIKNEITKTINESCYRRKIYKEIEKTILSEQQEKERSISYTELSNAMGIDKKKLYKIINSLSFMWNISLSQGFNYIQRKENNIENISDTKYCEDIEIKESKNIIREIIRELNIKERCVVNMRIYKNMKYAEIAKTLKYSPAWIEKIYKRALRILKNRLKELSDKIDIKSIIIE